MVSSICPMATMQSTAYTTSQEDAIFVNIYKHLPLRLNASSRLYRIVIGCLRLSEIWQPVCLRQQRKDHDQIIAR